MDSADSSRLAMTPRVRVGQERSTPRGWEYDVIVGRGESQRPVTVTLGWRDHDFWSGGASPPSRVVEAVLEYLLMKRVTLPASFDAARARYWVPEVDQELRETL